MRTRVLLFLPLLYSLLAFQIHAGQQVVSTTVPSSKNIETVQVYALAENIRLEVESIRYLMGSQKTAGTIVQVENAELREVYFQAVSLYNKIRRLHYHLLLETGADLPAVPVNIGPEEVRGVLLLCLSQLGDIKRQYGITAVQSSLTPGEEVGPSNIYVSLLSTIRQVNSMLQDRPYSPSDVYQEFTTAFYYMLHIYRRVEGTVMLPSPEPVLGKQPGDVYAEVKETYKTLAELFRLSGLHVLEMKAWPSGQVKPSEVYDMAVLISSELRFLYGKLPDTDPVYEAVYPGVKFPSHVFQRVVHLHNHLKVLLEKVRKNPQWLKKIK